MASSHRRASLSANLDVAYLGYICLCGDLQKEKTVTRPVP